MGKRIIIEEVQIAGRITVSSPQVYNLNGKVVSVSITNMSNSNNELIIGWNENPSTKNFLSAGESRGYGPYNEGQYLSKESLRFAFVNITGSALNPGVNQGLLIISKELDEEVC